MIVGGSRSGITRNPRDILGEFVNPQEAGMHALTHRAPAAFGITCTPRRPGHHVQGAGVVVENQRVRLLHGRIAHLFYGECR